jgi:hypothetical protein
VKKRTSEHTASITEEADDIRRMRAAGMNIPGDAIAPEVADELRAQASTRAGTDVTAQNHGELVGFKLAATADERRVVMLAERVRPTSSACLAIGGAIPLMRSSSVGVRLGSAFRMPITDAEDGPGHPTQPE